MSLYAKEAYVQRAWMPRPDRTVYGIVVEKHREDEPGVFYYRGILEVSGVAAAALPLGYRCWIVFSAPMDNTDTRRANDLRYRAVLMCYDRLLFCRLRNRPYSASRQWLFSPNQP